jgi:exopolysaccharide production protein ExoQ
MFILQSKRYLKRNPTVWSRMTISYRVLQNVFTGMALFLSTGAFLSLIVDTNLQASSDGSPATQVIWAFVFLVVFFLAISMYREILLLARANKSLCFLVLLAIISAAWSQDSAGTLRQSLALLATTLFGIEIALLYSIRKQLRLICIVLGSVILLSILVQIFLPGLLPQAGSDASVWQGAFAQKNTLGRIVVLGAAAFLCRPRYSRRDTLLVAMLMIIAGAVIFLAHSASSLVELIALAVIFRSVGVLRWRPSKLIITTFLILLITTPMLFLALNNFSAVTTAVGRDATLTGRTELWRLATQSIRSRPILGYGYGVFWDASSQEAARIRSVIQWDAPSAHNGYMDLLLGVGLVGLLLYVVAYVVAVRRAFILFRNDPENDTVWPLVLLAEILLCQLTEATIVSPHSIYWTLYVATCFSISKPFVLLEDGIRIGEPAESLPETAFTEV